MNLWVIFITGLTVGGLTCLAVQGGLLASVIAAREDEGAKPNKLHGVYSTTAFLMSKLIAYILLGLVLGLFGKAINISGQFQTWMQLLAGLYMIAVGLNLLNIHPIFRYVIPQPPRILTRLVRNQSRSKDLFAPALLGAMTVFIPCGTTLAMEALAISSANPFSGASIMGAFILGTIPLFFGIGFVTSLLGETFKKHFFRIAAVIVLSLGFSSLNSALIALDAPISIQITSNETYVSLDMPTNQNPVIEITTNGYQPNYIRVKSGEEVRLTLKTKDAFSCASAFRIPSLKLSKNLQPNETAVLTFIPTQKGKIPFTCSMGMYRGVIEAI